MMGEVASSQIAWPTGVVPVSSPPCASLNWEEVFTDHQQLLTFLAWSLQANFLQLRFPWFELSLPPIWSIQLWLLSMLSSQRCQDLVPPPPPPPNSHPEKDPEADPWHYPPSCCQFLSPTHFSLTPRKKNTSLCVKKNFPIFSQQLPILIWLAANTICMSGRTWIKGDLTFPFCHRSIIRNGDSTCCVPSVVSFMIDF